ncbi:RING finger domain-containing protein, partial [Mycobacterium kansasii]
MGLGAVPESRSSIASESDGSKCVICQDEFLGGMGILHMPCSHIFHGQCIIRWLEKSH